MKKRPYRKQKPRYITIRIQYYPFPTTFLFSVVFLFVFVSVAALTHSLLSNWRVTYTKAISPTIYKSYLSTPYEPPLQRQKEQVVFHGPRENKEISLTFDADMTPSMKSLYETGAVASYYNKQVIDILNQTQTKATLFLTGMWMEMYPDATREFATNPLFELASHSYSHPSFDGTCYGLHPIADFDDQTEIQKTQELLQSFGGVGAKLFRFPGGCYSQDDVASVSKNGLTAIQWDVAGQDGFNEDPFAIERNVIENVRNGSIIVLHMHGSMNAPKTAEALPGIISRLKEEGYTFVTVSELLDNKEKTEAFELQHFLLSYR